MNTMSMPSSPANAEKALADLAGVTVKQLQVGDYRINYATAGSGPAVVLVHGANIGWGQWYPNLPALASHYTVYALDLPGCGASTQTDFRHLEFQRDYVGTVLAFIKALGLSTVCLIGHSFGAAISVEIALQHAELVSKLVLVSPIGFTSRIPHKQKMVGVYPLIKLVSRTAMKPTHANIAKFLRSGFAHPEAATPEFINYYHSATSSSPTSQPLLFMNSLTQGFRMKPDVVVAHKLAQLRQPTLVIVGELDQNVPLSDVYRAAAQIPNGRLQKFGHSAHIPSIDQSQKFNSVVLNFLGGAAA